jgi:hypothetical protein
MILNEVSCDTKGDVTLRGTVEARTELTKTLDMINRIAGFNAQLGFANEINVGSKQLVQFQITITQRTVAK